MKNKYSLFILLSILSFNSCKEKTYYTEVTKVLESELDEKLKDYDKIFIIPGSGCTGCITSAEDFFIENVKNKKNKFIFTHNFSRKNLVLKLYKENLEQENVLIDDKNIFYLDKYEEKIYPITIELVGGKVSRIYSF